MTGALPSESNAAWFFLSSSIMHYEFVPEGQTINQDFCLAVLGCLQDVVQRKQPEMWEAGSSITIMRLLTQHCQLDNYWGNIQFLPFHNPLIHLTSPLQTSFYSLNSKLPLQEDFRQ
jgi:hypothetical protein